MTRFFLARDRPALAALHYFRAGASGIACGRGIWTEATSVPEAEREAFFRSVARVRLQRLYDIVETHARPWTIVSPRLDADLEGWYRS